MTFNINMMKSKNVIIRLLSSIRTICTNKQTLYDPDGEGICPSITSNEDVMKSQNIKAWINISVRTVRIN